MELAAALAICFARGRGFAAVVGGGSGRPWVRILHSILFCRLFHLNAVNKNKLYDTMVYNIILFVVC